MPPLETLLWPPMADNACLRPCFTCVIDISAHVLLTKLWQYTLPRVLSWLVSISPRLAPRFFVFRGTEVEICGCTFLFFQGVRNSATIAPMTVYQYDMRYCIHASYTIAKWKQVYQTKLWPHYGLCTTSCGVPEINTKRRFPLEFSFAVGQQRLLVSCRSSRTVYWKPKHWYQFSRNEDEIPVNNGIS